MENVKINDPEIFEIIKKEEGRQQSEIDLIASENYAPRAVLEATGSVLTNKYAEGTPGKRYYAGCRFVDQVGGQAHGLVDHAVKIHTILGLGRAVAGKVLQVAVEGR